MAPSQVGERNHARVKVIKIRVIAKPMALLYQRDLSAQGELAAIFHQRARIIAQLFTLLGEGVEIQMQPTRYCDHQDQVADVHFSDPAKSERFGFFQWGLEPIE